MLVSTKKMLEKAEKEHYAVAQININISGIKFTGDLGSIRRCRKIYGWL